MPYRIPVFTQEEILALREQRFNVNLANSLNLLFGSQLSAYDIDLALGRHCVRLKQLGQKIIVGECWHNTDWQIDRMINDLAVLISGDNNSVPEIKGWTKVGIRIAILFGIFGELIREEMADWTNPVDIAQVSGDFAGPLSAWYARKMGLPIGNIICCSNENAMLWDFICHGVLRTDGVAVKTAVNEASVVVPEYLEHLISLYGGPAEIEQYVQAMHQGSTYYMEDCCLNRLRQGLYVTVSSEKRVLNTISNAFSTHRYVLSTSAALAYAGLQDYRARSGSTKMSLIMTEINPAIESDFIGPLVGISENAVKQFIV